MHYRDAEKTNRENARCELHKISTSYTEQILQAPSHETTAKQLLTYQL